MSTQKFKGSLYILASVVAWYFVRSMTEWVIGRRFFPIPNFIFDMGSLFNDVMGVLAGGLVLAFLVMHVKSKTFVDEVAVETSKVTWPTMKETVNTTVVVTVAVVIAGFLIGTMDWFIGKVLQWGFYRHFMNG